MKRILVTNDDGINESGLTTLVAKLSGKYEVYAVAPAEQQSAKSMALTFMRNVSIEKTDLAGTKEAYIVDGTPVDCVLWAVPYFRERGIDFDYIFSGINLGANTGLAAYYSGTIGAARQGALFGVRSLALSLETDMPGSDKSAHFDYICNLIPKLLEISDSLAPSTMLSVNAPNLPAWEVKGLRFAGVAPYGHRELYGFDPADDQRTDEQTWEAPVDYRMHTHKLDSSKGKTQVRSAEIGGVLTPVAADEELLYDDDCVKSGYAVITPLSISYADEVALRRLQGRFATYDVMALFVDVQENITSGVEMRNRFAGNIGRYAACVRRLDVPVLTTTLSGSGPVIPELAEALDPGRTENVVRREMSAWGSGDFARTMNNVSVGKILIAGLETHTSVLQTATDFVRRGYEVVIIEDCCASRQGHDHKIAIERLRDAGCTITTSGAAVIELVGTTGHPAAAAVQKIIKR